MVFAVILAAGSGTRMNSSLTKQRMSVCGTSVIRRSVMAFDSCEDISGIVVVSREDELSYMKNELLGIKKLYKIVSGGKTRAESSYLGVSALPTECTTVAIHDAARCLITSDGISAVVREARRFGAACAATPLRDTVKGVDVSGVIISTASRESHIAVQTPQIFDRETLLRAFSSVDIRDATITDDNMLYERCGYGVATVYIGDDNLKITTPRDLAIAEIILKERENGKL